jgi:hypothetical protein
MEGRMKQRSRNNLAWPKKHLKNSELSVVMIKVIWRKPISLRGNKLVWRDSETKSSKIKLPLQTLIKAAACSRYTGWARFGSWWQEVKPTETLLNRHCTNLAKSFIMGSSHDEVDWVYKALKSTDNSPPAVFFVFKDIKMTEYGEPCLSTRQVCSGKEGPLARVSHLVS